MLLLFCFSRCLDWTRAAPASASTARCSRYAIVQSTYGRFARQRSARSCRRQSDPSHRPRFRQSEPRSAGRPEYATSSAIVAGSKYVDRQIIDIAGIFRMRTLLATLLLAGSFQPVQAQAEYEWSGNAFLPYCQAALAQRETSGAGICAGIVIAASSYGPYMREPLRNCVPSELPTGQKIRVVVKYLEDRPTRLHESFSVLVLEALRAGWPCKR